MGAVSSPADWSYAERGADSEAELLDQFLAYLERRRDGARRRFDELAQRRGSMSASERLVAHEALRIQAAQLSSELRRLKLADSLIRGLLRPSLHRPEGGPSWDSEHEETR